MALIERSSGVVVEAADRRPTSWVPVTKVRDGHQNLATGGEALAHLSQQVRRVDDMLDHIGGNDALVAAANLGRKAVVEIGLVKVIEALTHAIVLDQVDPVHRVAKGPRLRAEGAI